MDEQVQYPTDDETVTVSYDFHDSIVEDEEDNASSCTSNEPIDNANPTEMETDPEETTPHEEEDKPDETVPVQTVQEESVEQPLQHWSENDHSDAMQLLQTRLTDSEHWTHLVKCSTRNEDGSISTSSNRRCTITDPTNCLPSDTQQTGKQ
jgi:hypothetical protein